MPSYHAIRTTRLSDRQVLDLMDSLRTQAGLTAGSIQLGDGIDVQIENRERDDELFSQLGHDRFAIRSMSLYAPSGLQIDFYRGICGDVQHPAQNRQASPYFDELFLRANGDGSAEAAQAWINCIDVIERELPKTYPLEEFQNGAGAIDVLRVEVAQLSRNYAEMLSGLAEERSKLRADADEERAAKRKEYEEQTRELVASRASQQLEFDHYRKEEETKLRRRQEQLEQREKELDNRQHMHARRDLREKIVEEFKARTSKPIVSESAQRMRMRVLTFTLAGGVVIGILALAGFFELVQIQRATPLWLTVGLFVRNLLFVALAVGFLVYAINWLRTIYLDDVRAERRYEKQGHDIDRASFVIETIMEVGDKEHGGVPDAWVEGVCRNLFQDSVDQGSDSAPSSALASLLNNVAGAKLGPDGLEFAMKRGDARRIAKKIDGD